MHLTRQISVNLPVLKLAWMSRLEVGFNARWFTSAYIVTEVTHDFRNTPDADIQTDIHLSDGKALECGNVISESTAGTLKPRSFSHVSLADHCQTPNGLDTFTEAVDKYQSKQILVPKSQKTKAALNETHFLVDSCYSPSITSPVRPPPPLTIRKGKVLVSTNSSTRGLT